MVDVSLSRRLGSVGKAALTGATALGAAVMAGAAEADAGAGAGTGADTRTSSTGAGGAATGLETTSMCRSAEGDVTGVERAWGDCTMASACSCGSDPPEGLDTPADGSVSSFLGGVWETSIDTADVAPGLVAPVSCSSVVRAGEGGCFPAGLMNDEGCTGDGSVVDSTWSPSVAPSEPSAGWV